MGTAPALQPAPLFRRILRWSGKTIIFAVAATFTLTFIGLGYNWYSDRPTPAHSWPSKSLPFGLTLELKTMSRGSQVHYQFQANPKPEMVRTLQAVGPNLSRTDMFTVILQDKDGFEVCRHPFDVIGVAGEGGLSGLSSAGSFYCKDYKAAADWSFEFKSDLEKELTKPVNSDDSQEQNAKSDGSFDEVLAGVNTFERRLETVSGRVALVSSTGIYTANLWPNASPIRFTCKGRTCTIKNLRNGEIVRATLAK